MKKNKIFLALFSMIVLIIILNPAAQANTLPPSSLPIENVFSVPSGSNSYTDGDITVITKDSQSQIGSIFSTEANKIDLTQSFHAEMYVYLGNKKASAADGMTFVMHADKKRTEEFTGGAGAQLGVYAKKDSGAGAAGLQEQIEKSFAVEFDTYHNDDNLDKGIDLNNKKGHIAYSFPENKASYNLTPFGRVTSLIHKGLYYPKDYLSNGEWHFFSIDWNAAKKILVYNFDDAPSVSVPINPATVFGTNSVYWGFTGSTGLFSQESKVAFKQIPGLVNVSSSMSVTKDGKDITAIGVSAAEGDIKVQYDLKYNGGKQNLLTPVFNLNLDGFISYKPGTLKINGTIVSDDYFIDGKLNYDLPKDLSLLEDTFTISFEGRPQIVTNEDVKTSIDYSVTAKNYVGNILKTQFPIKKVNLVKSADFEHQSWLINEINRQLAPKKIDTDVFESDLDRITNITLTSGAIYPTEYIPATISKLTNLTNLHIANRKLIGSLPIELGDLTKLTTLSIYGNTFDGGIPTSLGKLTQVKSITLGNNHLDGIIPYSITLLPNLKRIDLNDNELSGQIPDFSLSMEHIALNNNQITYNLPTIPLFLTNIKENSYSNTFIDGFKLIGKAKVTSKSTQIKPFNELDTGYFNLKVGQTYGFEDLYVEHTYTIKNTLDGTVYYKGKRDRQVSIPYEKGISYTVILDNADKNLNNICVILGQESELKFEEIPAAISIKIKLGDKEKAVTLDGNVAIFDNRENKNWKLSITTSQLTHGQRVLQGEYSYTNKDGITYPIVNEQKFLIETGKSDSTNEIISISDSWNSNYGLNYRAYSSNYIGEYEGIVNWTLEDTP